jgi:hypothetical protein
MHYRGLNEIPSMSMPFLYALMRRSTRGADALRALACVTDDPGS